MDWIINILVNTLDLIAVYFLYCGLTESKPVVSLRNILIGCIWGVAMGTCTEFLENNLYIIIVHTCYLILLQLLYRKKIYTTFLIYSIIIVFNLMVQAFVLILIVQLPIHDSIGILMGQTLSTVIILIVYRKINISKFLKLIESTLPMKLIIYLCAVITIATFVFKSYEYEKLSPTLFYFIVIMGISMFGFIHTLYKIFFYTNRLPVKYHETKNALASICISAYNSNNIIYNEIYTYLKILGMDFTMKDIDTSKEYQNIFSLIEYKKQNNNLIKNILFDTDIRFFEPFEKVPEPVHMIILAILLDNAMEASPSGRKIKIFVHVAVNLLTIEVANISKLKVSEFSKMFEEGRTTKNDNYQSHGHGLVKLTEIVNEYNGKIFLESKYIEEEKSRYLVIRIEFKAWL